MSVIFITGPVRSGKSRFAVRRAGELGAPVTFVATGARTGEDTEWSARIERHRADRPKEWKTVEVAGSHSLIRATVNSCEPQSTLLIDSLGTWFADQFSQLPQNADTTATLEVLLDFGRYFVETVSSATANVIVVSEETGWSVHPEHASGRLFRDALGFTNQYLARLAQESYLVVCGYAIDLKSMRYIGDSE